MKSFERAYNNNNNNIYMYYIVCANANRATVINAIHRIQFINLSSGAFPNVTSTIFSKIFSISNRVFITTLLTSSTSKLMKKFIGVWMCLRSGGFRGVRKSFLYLPDDSIHLESNDYLHSRLHQLFVGTGPK